MEWRAGSSSHHEKTPKTKVHHRFQSPALVCLMNDLSIYVRVPEDVPRAWNTERNIQGEGREC